MGLLLAGAWTHCFGFLISTFYRPCGRRRVSPVMLRNHFLKVATCITRKTPTPSNRISRSVNPPQGGGPALQTRAVLGAPY